jgi:hypothetical protein
LTVPSTNTDGTDLTQAAYNGNDSNFRDEWRLFSMKYSFNVDHYYDQGFSLRFSFDLLLLKRMILEWLSLP